MTYDPLVEPMKVQATDPVWGIPIGEVEIKNTHDPKLCEGRGCSVHHPSDHHMKDWPMVWRADKHIFERTCSHGVGHPDIDDVAYYASIGSTWQGVHGCCGCC